MKKAILAVSFGTSYPDTLQRTIAATEEMLGKTFPDWEVRRAFTSGMIIRKLQKRVWRPRAIPMWPSSPPM